MYDLLSDSLIGVRTPAGAQYMNLPELLAALSAGQVDGYTGLRAHQADPWHVFLVQLAASIQARCPTDALPTDAAYWREGLLDLADGIPEAWQLVVEDVTKPAFMQHPWKSWQAEAADYGVKTSRGQTIFDPKASSPDELDVLVTAKNHDVKMARTAPDTAEAWIYALITYQTFSGYNGAGNYGSIRMNGGFGCRTVLRWTTTGNPSERFVDETWLLRSLRQSTYELFGYAKRGVVLTWLSVWNRSNHQYLLNQVEPWFIEAVRPLRIRHLGNGQLLALGATSKARQIGPKHLDSGDIGDPWIVIKVRDEPHSALDVTKAAGFDVKLLTNILFEDGFKLGPLQKPRQAEAHAWFTGSAVAREKRKGNTEGFHRFEIPVPAKACLALLQKANREMLGKLAHQLLTDAKDVSSALGVALAVLTEGGPEQADFKRVETWLNGARTTFAKHWEGLYFPTLWRGADEDHETVRRDWQQRLVDAGQALLDEAASRLALPSNRRWRALTQAESAWRGMLHKAGLPLPGRAATETPESEEQTA